ncbi:AMP phosphotransferase [Lyngbya aestuarii BL J]|uniref:AMP phosphotransferase n=2 Tax=Lyngbya aestuarii BL J TaxID=1348334 RepID=U7QE47_9CYAN|nr:polyphosphate:AMP phosphotransferase [Lyngbya aestuarii]ERT06148.1 AMP phosphotransferase [Lyngbya aestuarii BL J]
MLDTLDLNLSLDKETYQSQIESLMQKLRSLQQTCWEKKLPAIIVLEGWAVAGKGALVKKMVGYMDPRGFIVHPIWPPTREERRYPFMWRFWQKLPARGQMGIFYHSWYTHVLEDRLFERLPSAEVPMTMRQINAFERQMVDDGVVVAKFWIHLSQKELKHRLKKAAKDELKAWLVRPEDWQQEKNYDTYLAFAEDMLIHTSTGAAPWILIEGDSQRYARIKVLSAMVATLTEALDRRQVQLPPIRTPLQDHLDPTEPNPLGQIDLTQSLSEDDYKHKLSQQQARLGKLQREIYEQQVPVLAIFEGWDAAGKGGAIKRLTDILDPRSYEVQPFAAPTDEEKSHHYLWRFWRRLPSAGKIGIFDRSWYGRVLVERVEGFATDEEWRRAYREINEFEEQLTRAGYVLVKFWLHIDTDEQLKRFQARKENPFKQYKLTDEDWRNREKWPFYEVAVNQMIQRTHTPTAPWTIVGANCKYSARVQVVETVVEAIQRELQRRSKQK